MAAYTSNQDQKKYLNSLAALAVGQGFGAQCLELAVFARVEGSWPHVLAFSTWALSTRDLANEAAREMGVPSPKLDAAAFPKRLQDLLLCATDEPTHSLSWAMLSLECAKCQHWPLSLAFALDAFAFSHPQGQVRALAVHLIELSSARIGVQPRTRYLEQLADASI